MGTLNLGTSAEGQPLLLDPKALTTHGFILGMTGSGKTGLCVVLVEELLRAGVPVIAVDSKGDLGTLLLSFPPGAAELSTWTPDAAAASQRIQGALTTLGLSAEQFDAYRGSYQARLYTPGATIGLPLDLLGSLAPPADGSPEGLAESADGVTRGLLGLLGLEADPLTSREYLLLVQLFTTAWQQGQALTLVDLVKLVATPPFTSLGALTLDDFYPAKDRQALLVRLNGLLASPKLAAWRAGEPFDAGTLLRAPDGRPRLSIYSVAHLADEERLFAVAQLLQRTQSWMRQQAGASGLRAVVLIDEIFGYFPPAPSNPPTKPPLLGLLKQARAFGVSVVLATQNPIDLDYRGLANIGTWLVGRLQSEQDKARIRDALVSAAAQSGVTSAQLDDLIAQLKPRHFLLHSVHRPQPSVFGSRDAVTVLRGPFSADELRTITAPMKSAAPQGTASAAAATPPAPPAPVGLEAELGPLYEDEAGQALPYLVVKVGVRYRVGAQVSEETVHELAFPLEGVQAVTEALEGAPLVLQNVSLRESPPQGQRQVPLPAWVGGIKAARLRTAVKERLPSKLEATLLLDARTKLLSGPTESQDAFVTRVNLKQGLSKEAEKLARALEKKKVDLAQAEKEVTTRAAEKWMTVGVGVLGFLAGKKSMAGVGKALTSQRQQGTAEAKVEDLRTEVAQLEQQLVGLKEVDPTRFEEQKVVPRPADVQVTRLAYAFIVP